MAEAIQEAVALSGRGGSRRNQAGTTLYDAICWPPTN